ncbi:PAS domain-containing protein [Roseomonas xinghualingensis]|uniref:PAS domain-containing protein n=1 Tax=Roseomonas xinghualingensis TaxID=2986475 RepID=UPI0021F0FA54|nr:PAS domain-containing protein [Roseomonas sp. SXEYE001]MCV4208826.1 PAS domain-containing protein [Roseomonas sp. SXEYE001]
MRGALPTAGIRARLLLLVLAAVLPVLGFAGLAIWRFAEAQRGMVERNLLARAEGLARMVDSEFEALTSTLRTIAATDALRSGDLEGVHRHLVAMSGELKANLSLRDRDGRPILHSGVPYGQSLEHHPLRPEWAVPGAASQDAPRVTDLFLGTTSKAPSYGIILPLRGADGTRLLLAAGFPARHLAEQLRRELPEPGWTAVVVDRANRIVARSASAEASMGREAGPRFRNPANGIWRGKNYDGEAVVFAHAPIDVGWTVGASLAADVVDAPVHRAVQALLGVGALLLACAILLALVSGARIARAMRSLSDAAAALGKGEAVPPVRSALREADAVGAALSHASATIAARDAALREREAQLAQTQRLARVGGFEILIEHPPGAPLVFHNRRSPEYLALHGLGPEAAEEPHGAWVSRIHPEDRARGVADFIAFIEGKGSDYIAEYRVLTPAGETRWISALAEIERDAQGRAIRVRGVHVDVSALRRTEARLAENQAALAAAEERLRLALEAGGLIAFDVDLHTREGVFSPGHFAFLGLPAPPDLRGDLATWQSMRHPDDRPISREAWEKVLAEGGTTVMEYRIRTPRGERWIAATGRALPPSSSSPMGRFIGVYADVTERRAAQAVLEGRVREAVAAAEAAHAQLAQARRLEALGQLTGGVAHDFNNLLQVVASGTALLGRRPAVAADPGARRLLEGVAGAAERGAALTRRMLAFARRQELRIGVVDAAALIASLRDILARSLGPATPLEIDLPEGLWWVQADPNQLELALLNLCVNARDAMPPDHYPHGRVRVTVRNEPAGNRAKLSSGTGEVPPGDCLVIAVIDEGTGMDAGTLARATEPFFTTKGIGRGTGLGLSMVHGLCAQSGGALRLISVPGEGTTTEMWLPRAETGAGPVPDSSAVPAEPPGRRRLVVLVVDDDPLVLSSTAALVADLDHLAWVAGSAAAALEMLRAGQLPDLVLTDHAMPGMTGAELAARIAASHPGLPVILASGYADMAAGEAPDVPRLDKPFGREALAAAIMAALPAKRRPGGLVQEGWGASRAAPGAGIRKD